MKKYFLIVIAFSFASSLNAQDNQIGGTGNVGIGTTNPGAKLEVNGNISNSIGSGGTLTLFDNNSTRNNRMILGTDTAGGYLKTTWGSGGTDAISFRNSTGAHVMTLAENDNVGIGTPTPQYNLEVQSANTPTIAIGKSVSNTGGKSRLRFVAGTGANLWNKFHIDYSKDTSTDRLSFIDGGNVEIMSLVNGGNVGIGTTSPTEKLQIKEGNVSLLKSNLIFNNWTTNLPESGTIRWNEYSNATNKSGAYIKYDGAANYLQFFTNNETSQREHIRLNRHGNIALQPSDGNVGIGTTTPSAKLDVKEGVTQFKAGESGILGADINVTASGDWARDYSISSNGVERAHMGAFGTGSNLTYMYFDTSSSSTGYENPKMVITKAGKIGIGTKTPDGNMQIGGGTENGMLFLGGGKGYSGIGATRSDGGLVLGHNIYARYNDASDNLIARVGATHSSKGISGIKFSHAGVIDFFGTNQAVTADEVANSPERSKMRILGNGYVGIGTVTPAHKLDVNLTSETNFKTYDYGSEVKVVTSGGWARSNRFTNGTQSSKTVAFGVESGNAFIATGFDSSTDQTGYQNQKLSILGNGNVGIGTINPTAKLEVNGDIRNSIGSGGTLTLFENNETRKNMIVLGADDNGAYMSATYFTGGTDAISFRNSANEQVMTIANNDNVGIGTTTPGAYKLAVKGKIHTQEVKVDMIGWSDFVFEKDYSLPTLEEVAQHIQEKGHLKDIPSAKEVAKNGIFLGEMDAKLLQKIEELTLYTLAQEEKINAANTKIAQLESEKEDLKKLSKLVSALQTKIDTITEVKK